MNPNSKTLKAALFHGAGQPWTIITISDTNFNEDRAIIETEACTVCSSDIHTVMGRRGGPTPSVLGHEAIGRVWKLPDSWTLKDVEGRPCAIGQRLVWGVAASCGECLFCQNAIPQKCQRLVKYGHHRYTMGETPRGGFSQCVELVEGTPVVGLSDAIPAGMACLAACAGATVAATLRMAGGQNGQQILVYGGGVLGAIACRMAKSLGADLVICIEPDPLRRERALVFGADHAMDPSDLSIDDKLKSIAHDGLGADQALEFSGSGTAFASSMRAVRTGGMIVLAGAVFPAGSIEIEPEQIVRQMLTIRGVHNYSAIDLQSATAFLESEYRKFPEIWLMLAGESFAIDEMEKAFAWAAKSPGVRAIISMKK